MTTQAKNNIRINYYRHQGVWCYAAFIDGEFDASDSLDLGSEASEQAAHEAAQRLYDHILQASITVTRVDDTQ